MNFYTRDGERNNLRHYRLEIFFLGDVFPVVIRIGGETVLSKPFFNGETAGLLFLDQSDPFGKSSLVDSLGSVHENLLD